MPPKQSHPCRGTGPWQGQNDTRIAPLTHMNHLTVRQLLIDMKPPMDRHWNGDDAFLSALLDALSMSFPVGEQFFMDSLRVGLTHLTQDQQAHWGPQIQGFVGQEATHRRLHDLYNQHLAGLGYSNHWAPRLAKRFGRMDALKDPRHKVAVTAAIEHLTAILAAWLLQHPKVLAQAPQRMRQLWLWHASEEIEHRCTAFDLYLAMQGNDLWRKRWMRVASAYFTLDLLRQTTQHLWRDGQLFKWATWRSAKRWLLADQGLLRFGLSHWRGYFQVGYHPRQVDDTLAHQWLDQNQDQWRAISQP